ncbi:MAG: amino acid ABC transporter permease [Moraxellaceae bacterium]|nr:amino acid ABC transporter permease [Moraxellaceae bacterium]
MLSNFDFSVIPVSLPFIWEGLLYSFKLTITAMCGGIILGTLLALARLSGGPVLSRFAAAYVDTLRSIPLLMVILWFFFLIPLVTGKPMGAENSALITFTLFEAAFYSEIMRAGIQSIPKGQVNAGYAVGMTYWQTMGNVVLPQAFRNMLPVLLTQTIILFQDTSLVYAIGAKDLLKAAENTGKNYNRPVEMYVFSALIYFIICFSLSMLVKRLQKRIAIIR